MNSVEPIGILGLRQRPAERLRVFVQRARSSRATGAVGPSHVKTFGVDTREDVEHAACGNQRRIAAGFSHVGARPRFDKNVATWA
jgi:hypothetical protein